MRKIAVVTVLALGFLGMARPSDAGTYPGGSLTLTTSNLTVWPDHCGSARYSVAGPFRNAASWTVDLNVYDPHGAWSDGDYFESSDPVTSGAAHLCGTYDRPGRYRVTAEYETYDSDYNTIEHRTVTGHFTFTRRAKQASSLTVKKTRLRAHSWKMVGRLTKAGRAWPGHRVHIQAYVAGGWATLKAKTTNRNGRVIFTSTPQRGAGRYPVRLHSDGGAYVRDANSRTFRLKPR
jgi:hypothetical protein